MRSALNGWLKTTASTSAIKRHGRLSVIASLYDPLGIIASFSLSGKHSLQELCHRGIRCDEPLPEDIQPQWEEWINGLLKLKEVSIPRCYHPHGFHNIVRVDLHHFSKVKSIPGLELTVAVVSAKLSVMLKGEFDMKVDQEFFSTDLQVH